MTVAMAFEDACFLGKSYDDIKKQKHYFANKGPYNQSYDFSSSHVWMWELDYKESWALKDWWFCTVLLEKTLESPLNCEEIQPVHPKGDQSWIFIGKTDAEPETAILWSPDVKNWLIGKDPDAGKDWRWEEKGMTEDEMVGWHHWLNGHEFEQVSGVGNGQGSLVCCSTWGHKESDTNEWLICTELRWKNLLNLLCDNLWQCFSSRSQVNHTLESDWKVERGLGLEVELCSLRENV